jgi:hypothetical protein
MHYLEENKLRVNNTFLFLILSLVTIVTVMLTNDLLMSDELYFDLLEEQLANVEPHLPAFWPCSRKSASNANVEKCRKLSKNVEAA